MNDLLDKLGSPPFLYEDSRGIVAIGFGRVVRKVSDSDCRMYNKYKEITKKNNIDSDYITRVMFRIRNISNGIYCTDYEIHTPEGKVRQAYDYIELEEYINGLTEQEKESLIDQANMIRSLFEKHLKN